MNFPHIWSKINEYSSYFPGFGWQSLILSLFNLKKHKHLNLHTKTLKLYFKLQFLSQFWMQCCQLFIWFQHLCNLYKFQFVLLNCPKIKFFVPTKYLCLFWALSRSKSVFITTTVLGQFFDVWANFLAVIGTKL